MIFKSNIVTYIFIIKVIPQVETIFSAFTFTQIIQNQFFKPFLYGHCAGRYSQALASNCDNTLHKDNVSLVAQLLAKV